MARKFEPVARYNIKVPFYRPIRIETSENGNPVPVYDFDKPNYKLWCSRQDLVRENLEYLLSGAETTKKRVKLQTRFSDKITEDMVFKVDNNVYNIIIVGMDDKKFKESVIIGEVMIDSGY